LFEISYLIIGFCRKLHHIASYFVECRPWPTDLAHPKILAWCPLYFGVMCDEAYFSC